MWKKRDLLRQAFGELGLQGYEFDISPEEMVDALRRLDSMMGTWEAKGVRIGYAFPSGADGGDPDDASGIPDSAVETVSLSLAIRMAPGYGKTVNPDTKKAASAGYDTLLWAAAQPQQQQYPSTLPVGAGNRWRGQWNPYFPQPCNAPLGIAQGGDLEIFPE